jgi:twinkle protein
MIDLRDENIKFDGTEGTHKTKCPECQPPHKASDNPLSLTVQGDTAVWFCHHCGWKGNKGKSPTSLIRRKPIRKVEPPKIRETNLELYTFFAERNISKQTVDDFNITTDNYWIAFPYYDENCELVNIKYRTQDKRFKQEKDAQKSLYNYERSKESKEIIFVEGEIDVLSLYEIGFTNAISLPDGAPKEAKFNPNDLRFKALSNCPLQAEKIILFTDNDGAGKSLHDELLHRFGKDKCWYVEIPKDCKDANEVLVKHGREKLEEIIINAIPYPVDGLHTINDYFGNVIDLYNGNYVKPIEVGMTGLDEIYKILKGTFHTITGIPNHGKSYFLDQILLRIAQNHGWKFAFFSPEHSTSMHIRRLVQMHQEKSFDDDIGSRISKEELQTSMDFLKDYFYFIETKDEVPTIDYILEIAKGSILKHGVNGIIIDPYNEVNASRSGTVREDEHIRDFISKCKRFARLHDVVVFVVAHPTKLPKSNDGSYNPPTAYDISGASHWHNQSDVILTVHRDFDDNSTEIITRKIREQDLYGKIGKVTFDFDNQKKIFVERKFTTDFGDWHND